jgi:H+-translocating NAD(P) transhydrogenase subunit beta
MLIAVVATLLLKGSSYQWILAGGGDRRRHRRVAARAVKMTAMPEMVALFNGFGGLASLLVGWAEYHKRGGGWTAYQLGAPPDTMVATYLAASSSAAVTFTGS